MQDSLLDIIGVRIQVWAQKHPLIRRIYLYGSRVRGDYRPDSDLDVAIEFYKRSGDDSLWVTGYFEIPDLKIELRELIPEYKVQVEHLHPTRTPHVRKGIIESSILIYGSLE